MNVAISETDLSEKERQEIEGEVIRETEAEAIYRIISTETEAEDIHQIILKNTVLKPFGTNVKQFQAEVNYEYIAVNEKGKAYTEYRNFKLNFKKNPISESPYLIKIVGHYLCKADFLSLYNAFTTIIKSKADSILLTRREPDKNLIDNQMSLFDNQFYEPIFRDMFVDLIIKSRSSGKDIELSFELIHDNATGYGFKLDKDSSLSPQDIYFIYTNFDKIIQSSLDYDGQIDNY